MGSGKRNYKRRPKAFSLGAFKEEKEKKKVSKKDMDSLIELWKNQKKKRSKNP